MRLPCKFKSIKGVSVNSDAGRGCGFVPEKMVDETEMALSFRDNVLSLLNMPTASGRATIML